MKQYITDMKKAVAVERDALTLLADGIDETYEEVFELFLRCKGKLAFMGVGKSGHKGEKLAATFASLGIPAFYVHSTEAMHGDLGMIQPNDRRKRTFWDWRPLFRARSRWRSATRLRARFRRQKGLRAAIFTRFTPTARSVPC